MSLPENCERGEGVANDMCWGMRLRQSWLKYIQDLSRQVLECPDHYAGGIIGS
jgi:hypothetical protein